MGFVSRLWFPAHAVLSLLSAVRGDNNSSHPGTACQQLKERYQNQTSYPGSNEYVSGITGMFFRYICEREDAKVTQENWSESCVLQAYCLFEPTSARDVAGALEILTATDQIRRPWRWPYAYTRCRGDCRRDLDFDSELEPPEAHE